MYFQFKTRETTYELKFDNPLNFIIGDSAKGKTELIKLYNKCRGVGVKTDAPEVITELPTRYIDTIEPGSMVLVDLDDYDDVSKINDYVRSARDDIFTVLIGRKWIRRFPVAITNTFKFVTSNNVTRNIRLTDKFTNTGLFTEVLIEDSTSGMKFISDAISNVIVRSSHGASGIVKENVLNKNTLYVFDEFGFGGYIEEFMDKNIDGVPYIAWKSFEAFLLENHFGCIASYKFFNAEHNAATQLHDYCPNYSKKTWTTGTCKECSKCCKCNQSSVLRNSQYMWILDKKKSSLINAALKGVVH